MRRYYTESVKSLLEKLKKELKITLHFELQNELHQRWVSLPDPTLIRIEPEYRLLPDGVLELCTHSTVALNYIRQQKNMILEGIADIMEKYEIHQVTIVMAAR